MLNWILFVFSSTLTSFTLTFCPTSTTSFGSEIYLSTSWEICTSPSFLSQISTKAPKATTFLTTQSNVSPVWIVLISSFFPAFWWEEFTLGSWPIFAWDSKINSTVPAVTSGNNSWSFALFDSKLAGVILFSIT